MTSLPSHIEAYLTEAGFTGTEILVLKKLLESPTTTLRELAIKTGKSTGVLDQATKKLLRKKIISREMINDGPKFTLSSLDTIAQWMQNDMRRKRDMLTKKHQDFESFIASVRQDQARPEMEHFEGKEGLEKAYKKLLESGEQMLCYKPITLKEEDDPLRRFFVDFFRERRRRGVFLRTLAQNTSLGRRYQSRDAFEYRETVLMPEDSFPFAFEKIITGDIVACINHTEQKASFIRYPELAEVERSFFETIWRQEKCKGDVACATKQMPDEPEIASSTRTLSGLREFFLSKRSIAIMCVFGCISAAITYGLYAHNYHLNLQRVRERAMAIATTAVVNFSAEEIQLVEGIDDVETENYKKIVDKLARIRSENEGVVYAYILRPTKDPYFYSFVADADALDIYEQSDLNDDGLKNDVVPPGYLFYDEDGPDSILIDLKNGSVADHVPYADEWGVWISGHSPIKNSQGNYIASVGIDIDAQEVNNLSKSTLSPILVFAVMMIVFLAGRGLAFWRLT